MSKQVNLFDNEEVKAAHNPSKVTQMKVKSEKVRELESYLSVEVPEDAPDVFAEDGTDLTQIRMMLAMTPTERLQYIQSLAQNIVSIRRELQHSA